MMAATWSCQPGSAKLPAGWNTATVRLSSRLRPRSRLRADPSGAVVAQISWICWCRVGWLSLTCTIRATLAAAATSKCFLAVQRVEGDDRAMGDTEFGRERLCRRDLVGLAVDLDMSEHEGGIGGKRAQHLHGGLVMEIVEAAAQRLAVEGDAARPRAWRTPPATGWRDSGRPPPPRPDQAPGGYRGSPCARAPGATSARK